MADSGFSEWQLLLQANQEVFFIPVVKEKEECVEHGSVAPSVIKKEAAERGEVMFRKPPCCPACSFCALFRQREEVLNLRDDLVCRLQQNELVAKEASEEDAFAWAEINDKLKLRIAALDYVLKDWLQSCA